MAVISALEGGGIAQIKGQLGLHSKFQANLGYKGRPLIQESKEDRSFSESTLRGCEAWSSEGKGWVSVHRNRGSSTDRTFIQ